MKGKRRNCERGSLRELPQIVLSAQFGAVHLAELFVLRGGFHIRPCLREKEKNEILFTIGKSYSMM